VGFGFSVTILKGVTMKSMGSFLLTFLLLTTNTFSKDISLEEIKTVIKEKGYDFTVGETWVYKLPPEERSYADLFRLP
jgi:hypothetical protein